MTTRTTAPKSASRWLLLVHQLPPKPAYLRVKIWRRLQGLGAIAVKNAVYVLPASEQAREDFQWLLREVEEGGGDGMVCEAELVDGLRDDEVRALFDKARDADYAEIAKELRALKPKGRSKNRPGERKGQLDRLRHRFAGVVARDYFGATGRLTVEGLLKELEPPDAGAVEPASGRGGDLKNRTWVTRRGVYVDRIACAWLIRRFIDPAASFRFVEEKAYRHKAGELRFDMFQGEFTHEGDKCSIEVLLDRVAEKDAGLRAIAEIVHDIDLKDGKFGREETSGIAHVLDGICAAHAEDQVRIARASAVLDDVYARFRKRPR